MYSESLYSSTDRNKSEYLETLPPYINYLFHKHNLKQLCYGESHHNNYNFYKLKKSHLNNLKLIFENNHNCVVVFKYFGYAFIIENSMINKIPLLDKYYSGSVSLKPSYYIFNNHNKRFYLYSKIKGHQIGCQLIVLDLEIDLPFINLIFQVPKIVKFTSLNGCLYDNFLEIIYLNLQYEYTKEDSVPKSLIFKYLKEVISFLGIQLITYQEPNDNNMEIN